jgi:hypothetical protein
MTANPVKRTDSNDQFGDRWLLGTNSLEIVGRGARDTAMVRAR